MRCNIDPFVNVLFYFVPAQNSHTVSHVEYASEKMIRATVAALEADLPPAAVKLGMMGTEAVVSVVGDFLKGYKGKVVCDPVMISTRWASLRVICRTTLQVAAYQALRY